MIMFDYLTTNDQGGQNMKHPKKWLYNMEAAPKSSSFTLSNKQNITDYRF